MPRFKLTIEYAGTRYSGWQIQQNARTVQGEIDAAVRDLSRRDDFELYGSGRTDAGVHALAQVAHLELHTVLKPEALRRQINDRLPADINILSVEPAPHRFHARHDAVGRSYLYQVARRRTAFAKALVWWVREHLDAGAMREASQALVGRHDFRSFSDAEPGSQSTVVQVERIDLAEEGDLILIRVDGSHFLWKMVRRIVGVVVEAGRGGLTAADAARFLEERSPAPARLTAPASGLFLERVYYPGDTRRPPLAGVIRVARF
jgi:tRNA pseudouridine38-40 synthase